MSCRVALIACLALTIGCQDPLGVHSLDQEVNRLIQDTQSTTLGEQAPRDPRPILADTADHTGKDLYNDTPPTHNHKLGRDNSPKEHS